MNCKYIEKLLNLYIDDMLEGDIRKDVTFHIKNCESCRDKLYELEHIKLILGELPKEEVPFNLAANLKAKIREDQRESIRIRRRRSIIRGGIAVVATIVIGISIRSGFYTSKKSSDMGDREDTEIKHDMEIAEAPKERMQTKDDTIPQSESGDADMAKEDTSEKQSIDLEKGIFRDEDKFLTEDVIIYVQDVCITPQAVEWVARIHDIDVLKIGEDSITLEVDSKPKRDVLLEELHKLGIVENIGSDRDSSQIKITITEKE